MGEKMTRRSNGRRDEIQQKMKQERKEGDREKRRAVPVSPTGDIRWRSSKPERIEATPRGLQNNGARLSLYFVSTRDCDSDE